jgi:hypothetical protein
VPHLLDANVFIQAKNLHYGLDFCPAFWDWLVREKRIKIPDACVGVGVKVMTPWEMLRTERARFELGGRAAPPRKPK